MLRCSRNTKSFWPHLQACVSVDLTALGRSLRNTSQLCSRARCSQALSHHQQGSSGKHSQHLQASKHHTQLTFTPYKWLHQVDVRQGYACFPTPASKGSPEKHFACKRPNIRFSNMENLALEVAHMIVTQMGGKLYHFHYYSSSGEGTFSKLSSIWCLVWILLHSLRLKWKRCSEVMLQNELALCWMKDLYGQVYNIVM